MSYCRMYVLKQQESTPLNIDSWICKFIIDDKLWFIGLQCIVCTLLNEWMNICLWYHTPHKIAHFLLLYSQAKLSGVKKTGCEENLFNGTKEIALRGISSTTSYTYRSLPLANSLCLLFHCICCHIIDCQILIVSAVKLSTAKY